MIDLSAIAARIAADTAVQANIAKLGQPVRLELVKVVATWGPDTARPVGDVNTDLRPLDEYYYNNNLDFRRFLLRIREGSREPAPKIVNPHL